MQTVTSAWVLIVIGLVFITAAMLAGQDYRWIALLGLAIGAVMVVVGLRRRRQTVVPPGH